MEYSTTAVRTYVALTYLGMVGYIARIQNGLARCFSAVAVALTSTLLSHGDHSGCRWRFEYRKYAASLEAGNSKETFSKQPATTWRRSRHEPVRHQKEPEASAN